MSLILWDQLSSWILVAVCLWLVHQTAPAECDRDICRMRRRLSRGTYAFIGLAVAVGTLFKFFGDFIVPASVWKSLLAMLLVGLVIFHKKRFNKL